MPSKQTTEHRRPLRASAETRLADAARAEASGRPAAELLHELQVHQIELEMQNEELRRTQAALEEARDRYLDLYEFAPVGYITVSDDGLVTEVNLAGAALLGAERKALLGRRFAAFVAPDALSRWHGFFESVTKRDERQTCELAMQHGDGSVFHGQLECVRAMTGEGPRVRIVLADVTERARIEEELRMAQRLDSLALLTGGIAHDFNNLLTALFGHMEAAKSAIPPGEAAAQDLEVALSALERARGLTRQLLVFGGGGGGGSRRNALAVPKLLTDSVAIGLGGSSIHAHLELPADLPLVDVDEGEMSQVLDNLLLNARQAMPAGGDIHIGAARRSLEGGEVSALPSGEYVEISVRDSGEGIPKEIQRKIFDPFFTTREHGRGLGLAVCHAIMRRYGGHIAVRSEVGVGTTFTLLLPAATAQLAVPTPVQALASKFHVLLMDDDPMVLKVGVNGLRALGCSTDTAACGEEAIALYRKAMAAGAPYDVVILDLTVVGGMGGEVAVQQLQQLDPNVCAVACSGYFQGGIMSDPVKHGFRAVLPKPYTRNDLLTVLGSVSLPPASRTPAS